jgi:membrane fusion protein (multidrug efflux system)
VLQYKDVVAPFNGYAEYRQVNLGDYVKAGQPLIRLVDTQDLYVGYALPSKYSSLVTVGQSVKIVIPSIKASTTGKVTFVGKQVNPATRSFAIQASVPNTSGKVKPGMFAKVENLLNPNRKLLVIPAGSVLTDLKGQYVYVIKNNKAQRVAITTVIGTDNNAYVSSGLKAGQQVAVSNDQLLTNNASVKVVKQ